MLGVGIERGRGLHVSDDRPDAPEAVAVISYAAWQVRFGADPAIVGRRIRLDEIPFTVVGVAADTFTGTAVDRKDIWVPMSAVALLRPGNAGVRERFASLKHSAIALGGRLMPDVPRAQAQAEMELLNRRFRLQSSLEDHGVLLMDTTFFNNPFKRKGTVSVFVMLFLGVLLVLVLACANVGNLLIARAAARRREVAVRLALGAGRWRLVRQLLTESMTLACGAAKLGLGLATALPTVLLQLFEVFGVFRYVVQQRTREIGIRMALGARPRQLVAFVVVSGGRALAIGLAIGLAGAFGASAILRGSLHGLSALDPGAYVGAASILAITGVVAVYLPARRATRVEPTSALRCE